MMRELSDKELEVLNKTGSFSFEGDSVKHKQLLDDYVSSPSTCSYRLRIKLSSKGTAKLCRYLGILNSPYNLDKALRCHIRPEVQLMQNKFALKGLVQRKHIMIRVDYEKETSRFTNIPSFGFYMPNATKLVSRSCMVPFTKEDFIFTLINHKKQRYLKTQLSLLLGVSPVSRTDELLELFKAKQKVKIDPFKDHEFLTLLSRSKLKFKYEIHLSDFGIFKIEKICKERNFELNSVITYAEKLILENTDYISQYIYFAFMYRDYEFYLYDCHLDFFVKRQRDCAILPIINEYLKAKTFILGTENLTTTRLCPV